MRYAVTIALLLLAAWLLYQGITGAPLPMHQNPAVMVTYQ